MIIIPRLTHELLELDAYTYNNSEFEILNNFLKENKIVFEYKPLPNDSYTRLGRVFIIHYNNQIQKIEFSLGVKFINKGIETFTKVEEDYIEGKEYKCLRISPSTKEKGCRNIYAINDAAAFIKCNLIANELNWFAAQRQRGKCKGKSLWNIFK